ncbi:sporulation protein [Nonomuraea roseoviolacea]|uniref:Sporulation-control protein n=1 Tax=Nonomuraea roseoviolacea subsp. carminata TaxID=160689 RepID=A0ABT1KF45_9ACTN|nr:sporulation protein [Nonomuraea roseoviolacea]MCP2352643.1 sporulation-control protein [Nonomuraea roseoviolacea subsp. carminata]
MVFKRMLGALGVGAPSVDTVLATPLVRPGGALSGEVRLAGGDFDADIEHITLGLVAGVEIEGGEGEASGLAEFYRVQVSGPFRLAEKEQRAIPFQITLPWETPLNEVEGQPLAGMAVGVRTELAIAKAVDKGDLDPVSVEPLPSQLRVLRSFLELGFQFRSADVEVGQIYGVRQELPFFQEIEFYPPPRYAGQVGEVELTFVADPHGLEVILEADKRSGRFGGSNDAIGRFRVSHDEAQAMDWAGEIDRWLGGLAHFGGHGYGHGGHDAGHGFGHGGHYADHHGGHHGGGAGLGAVAAAGAAGLVGGYLAGEAIEEIFESDDEGGGDDW